MSNHPIKSAFPFQGMDHRNGQSFEAVYDTGMTLRDYFAAKAMQSLLGKDTWVQSGPDMFAKDAYTVADAMLEARKS